MTTTAPPKKILLVEDSRSDALLLQEILLAAATASFELTWADHLKKALDLVKRERFDAILLDLTLPDSHGLTTLELVQSAVQDIPIVIVTGLEDEQMAISAIRQGAQDYLVKGSLDGRGMARSIQYAMDRKGAEEALRRSEQRFKLLSETAGALLEAQDPQAIVERLCTEVMKHLDCQAFFNFLVDERAGRLHLNAFAGIPKREARKIEWLDYGVAVRGCAARDACRIVAEDIPSISDPRTELVKSYGIQAYCCHPLIAAGRVIGTLSFGTKTRARFSVEDIAVMKTVADQVSIAMQRLLDQETLQRANAAKDQFLAALSHELRTPLTPALVGVGALLEQQHLPGPTREFLEMVQRNIALEVQLIDDLLDVTRIAKGKVKLDRQLLDAATVLRGAAAICGPDLAAKRLALNVATPGAPYPVLGDSPRLHQVFWNLIKNAVKFTPAGGRIGLKCSVLRGQEPALAVEVQDTGVGIDPDELENIFYPFEQAGGAALGGLGLGLTICRSVVELHGGHISAFSEGSGKGATFTVVLPLASPATASEARVPSAAAVPAGPRSVQPLRILLVEDHADTAYFMAREIKRKGGHEVKTAGSVKEALAAVEGDSFDLLLCDVGLPDGTGPDLMRQVLATGKPIRGVALSGYCMPEDEQRSLKAGFIEHLTKPITVEKLLEAVQRVAASDPSAQAASDPPKA